MALMNSFGGIKEGLFGAESRGAVGRLERLLKSPTAVKGASQEELEGILKAIDEMRAKRADPVARGAAAKLRERLDSAIKAKRQEKEAAAAKHKPTRPADPKVSEASASKPS